MHVNGDSVGFRYIYGKNLSQLRKIQRTCEKELELLGFEEVVTPVVVPRSLIIGEQFSPVSKKNSSIVFNISSKSERLSLRYENTFPVCYFYVNNLRKRHHKSPCKLYYVSSHYRNEKSVNVNHLREFHQVGWEILGGEKTSIKISIQVGANILKALNLKYEVRLSDVNIIGKILDVYNLNNKKRRKILQILDKGEEIDVTTFCEANSLKNDKRELLFLLKTVKGDPHAIREKLFPIFERNSLTSVINICENMFKIYKRLALGGEELINIDLSLVRSNRFYSGVIFQYYFPGNDSECGGGGEYNNIIQAIGGPSTKASGGAFGLERLILEHDKKQKTSKK